MGRVKKFLNVQRERSISMLLFKPANSVSFFLKGVVFLSCVGLFFNFFVSAMPLSQEEVSKIFNEERTSTQVQGCALKLFNVVPSLGMFDIFPVVKELENVSSDRLEKVTTEVVKYLETNELDWLKTIGDEDEEGEEESEECVDDLLNLETTGDEDEDEGEEREAREESWECVDYLLNLIWVCDAVPLEFRTEAFFTFVIGFLDKLYLDKDRVWDDYHIDRRTLKSFSKIPKGKQESVRAAAFEILEDIPQGKRETKAGPFLIEALGVLYGDSDSKGEQLKQLVLTDFLPKIHEDQKRLLYIPRVLRFLGLQEEENYDFIVGQLSELVNACPVNACRCLDFLLEEERSKEERADIGYFVSFLKERADIDCFGTFLENFFEWNSDEESISMDEIQYIGSFPVGKRKEVVDALSRLLKLLKMKTETKWDFSQALSKLWKSLEPQKGSFEWHELVARIIESALKKMPQGAEMEFISMDSKEIDLEDVQDAFEIWWKFLASNILEDPIDFLRIIGGFSKEQRDIFPQFLSRKETTYFSGAMNSIYDCDLEIKKKKREGFCTLFRKELNAFKRRKWMRKHMPLMMSLGDVFWSFIRWEKVKEDSLYTMLERVYQETRSLE